MGLFGFGKVKMKGVVYSEDWSPPLDHFETKHVNIFANVDVDNISPSTQHMISRKVLSPEEDPYDFWEKTGMMPLHPTRLRQRQYYMPTTDFRHYDYDDPAPEEQLLKAKWLAKMFEWDSTWGFIAMIGLSFPSMKFPFMYRFMWCACVGFSCGWWTIVKTYCDAMPERADLDDFIAAKEMYYIKNVERKEMVLDYPRNEKELAREQQRFGFSSETGSIYENPYEGKAEPTDSQGRGLASLQSRIYQPADEEKNGMYDEDGLLKEEVVAKMKI